MQRKVGQSMEELEEVMEKLLSPQGCPWDREQTHQTLGRYLIEECYETLEAIEKGDDDQLKEELGDVLLQVVFHAALAKQAGNFDLDLVIKGVSEKMIRRHPHVFASMPLFTSQDVIDNWESFKKQEGKKRIMEGVPAMLPALLRALRVQEKAARAGMDFKNPESALAKLIEEAGEFAIAENTAEQHNELGDILFAIVNIARLKGLDSEAALQSSNDKFIRRVNYVEEQIQIENRSFNDYTVEELDVFWEQAKELENQ